MKINENAYNLVSYSRAGDVFHYRWAARRCLGLIKPQSDLESIVIEGSKERKKAGEYVIDVSEYYQSDKDTRRIEYYQLKHTTVQHEKPFTLSGLKDTMVGFAERYLQHLQDKATTEISFTVITNRKISDTFKRNLSNYVHQKNVNEEFEKTLKKYSKLNGAKLRHFCSLLNLEDGEGDYDIQKNTLRIEIARIQPGIIDSAQVSNIVALVQEKVLPKSNGIIHQEDILKLFGVTSEKHLFPAPPLFEQSDNLTHRFQYNTLIETILHSNHPLIIHAEGGVGKSVFSKYVLKALPEDSLGIAYDCFGSGKYRSRSEPRHRHRDALLQISNELASLGLCERMLIQNTTPESDIMRGFLYRIQAAIMTLKEVNNMAKLVILIDAADNAEMAAMEFGDACFANELLREQFPEDCKIVLLCRPERTALLKPPTNIQKLELSPFSKKETFENLRKCFPAVNENEAYEFHRLTGGNPRVQMNSIAENHESVEALLSYLGPFKTSVEEQIEQQLQTAVNNIKDVLPDVYQSSIEKICTGLASLPPNIPIHILATAADVRVEDVKSFISDIGRSLWLLDSSVQFRDEPTETWFRNTFLGTPEDFQRYIAAMEPLATKFTYVAEVLPQLYLQAGQYDQLIRIAISDTLLPFHNPIDTRNVMVYRLQFAFKAALRAGKYKDAIQVALRAGEEVAGDQRQQSLFQDNVDLLTKLQDKLKIQEIAFKGLLKSGWEGSENIYTASLLSEIEEYQGEARGYLRSALNWLQICFETQKRQKNDYDRDHVVNDSDILEIALTQLNLDGAKACLKFLNSLKPKEAIYRIIRKFISRLIDAGRLDDIQVLLKLSRKSKFYVIAIVHELSEVGIFAEAKNIKHCLQLLSKNTSRIKKPAHSLQDNITSSIIAFLEVCLYRKLNTQNILKVLDYYLPEETPQGIAGNFVSKDRTQFLKAVSIRNVLLSKSEIDLEDLLPESFKSSEKQRGKASDIKEFKEVIGALLPWYILRIKLISGKIDDFPEATAQAHNASKKAHQTRYRISDHLPKEIADFSADILIFCHQQTPKIIQKYHDTYLRDNQSLSIHQRLYLLRAGQLKSHLIPILNELENSTLILIKDLNTIGPEESANYYILMARAVLSHSREDAAVYFEEAITIISKFGDEIVERWEALASLGKRCGSSASDKLAYRFVRCTELVGEYVYREKHWDRSGALATCTKMSPAIGIAALSRWRDREIGRFEYQLEALLIQLIESKSLTPEVGWSMTRFISDHQLFDFLKLCLSHTSSECLKSEILNDAYKLLLQEGASYSELKQLLQIAEDSKIHLDGLEKNLHTYPDGLKDHSNSSPSYSDTQPKINPKKWNTVFDGADILSIHGFTILRERFSAAFKKEHYVGIKTLFREILNRIKPHEIYDFFDLLLTSDDINYYDSIQLLKVIPEHWKHKVSFKKKWPDILFEMGRRYAHDLVNLYSFETAVRELNLDDALKDTLKRGIFLGLSEGQEFTNATVLFGFIRQATTSIDPEEARELVDYALTRFELHVENDFGDGPWKDWLKVSDNIHDTVGGFLWSALGAPSSETRWQACHVIKKLADFKCTEMLSALVTWLEHDEVDAFGSHQFPFYKLHASQYLLIALSRVSTEHPAMLVPYKQLFLKYALTKSHVLIQKFSTEIALAIEEAFPATYSPTEINGLKKSTYPLKTIEIGKYDAKADSYFHKKNQLDTTVDYYFGWDIERYWFEPLGDVFGIPGKQVQELCADVIVNEWKLGTITGYNNDPRVGLWNKSQGRTWHDHGNYPKTDSLDFYLAYHAMLCVASRLYKYMPVISIYEDHEDPWKEWLSRHLLTRNNHKWLADCRGPVPHHRPDWISKSPYKGWRTDFKDSDFLNNLYISDENESWLTIHGGWTERHDSRYESYTVSSALVSKKTADALLRALSTCNNSHDFKLPDYEESNMEIRFGDFQLKGWLAKPYVSKGIDEMDPYAKHINYPPIVPGTTVLNKLELHPDCEGKVWVFSDGQAALKTISWSSNLQGYDDEPEQSGERSSASLNLLIKLCTLYDCHLIFEVTINRDITYRNRLDTYEYLDPRHKIYILSKDGRLKSTEKNYQLR